MRGCHLLYNPSCESCVGTWREWEAQLLALTSQKHADRLAEIEWRKKAIANGWKYCID